MEEMLSKVPQKICKAASDRTGVNFHAVGSAAIPKDDMQKPKKNLVPPGAQSEASLIKLLHFFCLSFLF
jgi:hypothetical protein